MESMMGAATPVENADVNAPLIESQPGKLSGQFCFAGTRLTVDVLFNHLATGGTVDSFAKEYRIPSQCASALLRQAGRDLAASPKARLGDPQVVTKYESPINHRDCLTAPARDGAMALLCDLRSELALIGVTGAYLFGSVARGDDDDSSDLDVAVRTIDPLDVMIDARAGELLTAHAGRKVDVVPMPLPGRLAEMAGDELMRVF